MIQAASSPCLNMDYFSLGLTIPGSLVKTDGSLSFLCANYAKASSFTEHLKMQRCIESSYKLTTTPKPGFDFPLISVLLGLYLNYFLKIHMKRQKTTLHV